jgi:myo-inositol 2-dehydrogenase / D-chiro-inositol 1-dehydrogenase
MQSDKATRRSFLQRSGGALAGAALASTLSTRAYAAENNTIKVVLVGCGGRGTGATSEALSTEGPTQLWAVADFFDYKVKSTLNNLKRFGKKAEVPAERQFSGLDGYRKAIDSAGPGAVIVLATPPAFRPIHVEYAVSKNCHVFMEKSFAVDAPGIRRVLRAGEEAKKKNLKIAGGLRCRHEKAMEDCVQKLHEGTIGDVIAMYAYRVHGPVSQIGLKGPRETELGHQIANYSNFTWLNGSYLLDWLIHNIDNCCWIKQAWPVFAQGQGGRQVRTAHDQLFDHYAVEYTFADGTRMMAEGRHMDGTWNFFGVVAHGSKGAAVLGEGEWQPKIYKGWQQSSANLIWKGKAPTWQGHDNPYQVEHDLLFEAIRQDKPYNESDWSCKSAMAGIMGRMAAESGKGITWDEAMASNLELAPGLDHYTMDSNPPVIPDAQGRYPVAMPGITKVL